MVLLIGFLSPGSSRLHETFELDGQRAWGSLAGCLRTLGLTLPLPGLILGCPPMPGPARQSPVVSTPPSGCHQVNLSSSLPSGPWGSNFAPTLHLCQRCSGGRPFDVAAWSWGLGPFAIVIGPFILIGVLAPACGWAARRFTLMAPAGGSRVNIVALHGRVFRGNLSHLVTPRGH